MTASLLGWCVGEDAWVRGVEEGESCKFWFFFGEEGAVVVCIGEELDQQALCCGV